MKRCLLFLLFLFPLVSFSQWQATKGPYGGNISAFYEYNNTLYAGTTAGLFATTDNGENWKFIDVGFPVNVTAIAEMGGRIFVGTLGGVVCSSDKGISWQRMNAGLSTYYRFCGRCIRGFSVNGNEIFAATDNGLYKIKNSTTSWAYVTNGHFDTFSGKSSTMISSERIRYGDGCRSKISTDAGVSFRPITFPDTSICNNFSYSLDVSSHGIFAVTDYHLYLSIDNGYTWTSIYNDTADYAPTMVKVINDNVYLATRGKGLLVSSINTFSWTNTGISPFTINTIYKSKNTLFAGMNFNRGVYSSGINNYKWTEKNNGLSAMQIYSIESENNFIVAGSHGGITISIDTGYTWKKSYIRFPGKPFDKDNNFGIEEIAINGKIILAGSGHNVFISLDSGSTWTLMNQPNEDIIAGLAIIGSRLIVCTWFNLFYSDDYGKTWKTGQLPGNKLIRDLAYDSNSLYINSMYNIYVSHNSGISWDSISGPNTSTYSSLKLKDSLLFLVSGSEGLYTGSKEGSSWFHSYTNDPNNYFAHYNIGTTNKDVFISDKQTLPGLMHSSDLGQTWSKDNTFANHHVEQLGSSKHFVYASTPGFGIWRYGAQNLALNTTEYSFSNFEIYPNPTSGIFTVKLNKLSDAELCVYDLSGKCVFGKVQIKNLRLSIDLSNKPKGVYFIEVVSDKVKTIKKIVLN